MARQATDSFVIEIDGAPIYVGKGEVLPESHPVLKQLGKDTHLFRPWEEETPPPQKTSKSRSG
jgi:hypothetical protein